MNVFHFVAFELPANKSMMQSKVVDELDANFTHPCFTKVP